MNAARSTSYRRPGAIAPLVLILLIPLLAMVVFSVDIGYVCVVKAELQNAADSAALAGASQLLLPDFPGIDMSAGGASSAANAGSSLMSANPALAVAAARTEAKKYAKLNYGGSVALDLNDADVVLGNKASLASPLVVWTGSGTEPNSVQVKLRRDSTANTPLPLFFAPVLGISNWSGTAMATASIRSDMRNITGFESWPGGPNATLLPITIHVDTWKNFLNTGKSPDGTSYDDYTVKVPVTSGNWNNNVSSSADGTPEVTGVYPDPTTPGNWGLLLLDPTESPSIPPLERWIRNGPTPSELSNFGPNGLQATPDVPASVPGGPGLKSSLVPDFEAIIGQPRSIPLYKTYSDNGNNTTYEIVGFAGVTIAKAQNRGSNIEIAFQPALVVDPTATPGSSQTPGSTFIYSDSPIVLTK